ncbi:MAG TPA: glucokinase [Solirubrobacteraceae bacterium]|nr:glucokinase [Solirubrobacteraceae bacterium]
MSVFATTTDGSPSSVTPTPAILAGDVGATHTRLAVFADDRRIPVAFESYASHDHAGLEEMVRTFLAEHPTELDCACFGVAGPVRDGHVKTTNLAWPVDAASLAQVLSLQSVALINDLAANAYGIAELAPDDLEALNRGVPVPDGAAVVISAGTGLGEAGVLRDGDGIRVIPTEGGHTDFGPRSELELELYRYLAAEDAHVSYERVCSGIGLLNIYRFLRRRSGTPEPPWLGTEIAHRDASAAISRAALRQRDPVCIEALDMMVSIYGAEAGNLALKYLATGGVYVGGGIAPQILPKLREGTFMRSFTAKGRFAELLEQVPVRVILNDDTALLGAAHHARTLAPARTWT